MKIRTYGRTELAQIYFPYLTPISAYKKLKRWIALNPELTDRLYKLRASSKCRTYTPAQVAAIFEILGEPGE